MNERHRFIAIVQEHRWSLDGSSWGGFSTYPISIRTSIFQEFPEDSIAQLIKSGDHIIESLEQLSLTSYKKVNNSVRRIKNKFLKNSGKMHRADLILKILRTYNPNKATIVDHQMNSFE
jgi:hypothetical protein